MSFKRRLYIEPWPRFDVGRAARIHPVKMTDLVIL
jgi:hypothetical protein